jgi:hypothetical protein
MNAPDSFFDTVVRPMFKSIEHRRMRDVIREISAQAHQWIDSETEALGVVVIEPVQPWEIDA